MTSPVDPTNAPSVPPRPALEPRGGGENRQGRRAKRARANGATQIVPAYAGREPPRTGRVRLDGKFFAIGSQRFDVRGVTYGTFAPRADGALFPERPRLKRDLQAMRAAGFNVVRTYTAPPEDFLECAADQGLRVLAGLFYPDWRYVLGGSRRGHRRIARDAAQHVRAEAQRLGGRDEVMALTLGNEVPADVLRWYGSRVVADTLRELARIVREEDADQLVTYANYPTAEYLPLDQLDFLMFNVFLERRVDLRRYVTRLHHLAGDRPLVLGEVGFAGEPTPEGERGQAEMLDWQLEIAVDRGVAGMCVYSWTDEWNVGGEPVVGWRFGLTRADRSARPALGVAARWNRRTVRDLDFRWPSISVVVCAHNAAATIDTCLRDTCALDYPRLEVIVIDDGSTDDTAAIAERHPRVRLVKLERNGGLSAARNAGIEAARGEVVAYLDADAYPSPEWPYYLALGLDAKDVGGCGGPNLPPEDDPTAAHVVARAPGGPVHVLTEDDRAEHIPGCNMAFWKIVLVEVGGFDPVYRAAGDDVDLCWKVLDRRWKIGFHPAAMVWHHRRPGLRAYLRQQRGYGRSEALVEARHPERFTPAGTARWRGRIYNSAVPRVIGRQRVYRGVYGTAPYQSVYQAGGHTVDLLHQVGIPLAAMLVPAACLAVFHRWLALPAVLAVLAVIALFISDVARADPPRRLTRGRLRFRISVALHCLLQPLVRWWARSRHRHGAMRGVAAQANLPSPVDHLPGGVVVVLEDRSRPELAAGLIAAARSRGIRATHPSPWRDCDAGMMLSRSVSGELQTSSHPEGFVQIRIRPRPRPRFLIGALGLVAIAAYTTPVGALLVLVPVISAARGTLRARRLPAQLLAPEEPA